MSPSTHQDSPKVPLLIGRGQIEAVAKARHERTRPDAIERWDDLDPNGSIRPGMCHEALEDIEEIAPVVLSALLSDEVVEAVARRDPDWTAIEEALAKPDRYPETLSAWKARRDKILDRARADLQAAIEKAGGGQGA